MKKILVILSLLFSFEIVNAQEIKKEDAYIFIKNRAKIFKIKLENSHDFLVNNAYSDVHSKIDFFYVQQTFKEVKVYNRIKTIAYYGNNLKYQSGNFNYNNLQISSNAIPTLGAAKAIKLIFNDLQINSQKEIKEVENLFDKQKKIVFTCNDVARKNIKTELVWYNESDTNVTKLCWIISIALKNTTENWCYFVDASNGFILNKINETVEENFEENKHAHLQNHNHLNQSDFNEKINQKFKIFPPTANNAAYNVIPFPFENIYNGAIAIENNPWLRAGNNNKAISHGWHYDGTSNYNDTRGNNVFCYDDSADLDMPGRFAISLSNTSNLNFNFVPNFNTQPTTANNRNFATTNLFYWNNITHDIMYQYGFDELSGNFQIDNIGRGGVGNDAVKAEAQDGGGVNNANFYTEPDGGEAVMQMYLFKSTKIFSVLSPNAIAASYNAREGNLSANNRLANLNPVTAQVALYNDNMANTQNACVSPSNNLTGKIALIRYSFLSGCTFAGRIKNAQNAGAVGVIIINSSNSLITMGGADNSITIPAVMVSLNTGNILINSLQGTEPLIAKLEVGIDFDGDLDNGIIVHEYGHGISNRLTGGAANTSCLRNAEQAGEGWSDYFALMLTTNWANATLNDGIIQRPMGVYAFNQSATGNGIRAFPYTTNFSLNPLTYANMQSNGQVHFIGTIWCSTLWDMTWNIIQQENTINPNLYNAAGIGGNVVALNLVMLGLKLQPCSPGFLDARDAILAADDILYGGIHKCAIWSAFAKRGMGIKASQGSSYSTTDQVSNFDVPNGVSLANSSVYEIVNATSNIKFNFSATCQCKLPVNSYKIKAIIPQQFSYSSSNNGVLNADTVTFSNLFFSKTFDTDSFSLTLNATGNGCNIDSIINDNRDAKLVGGFTNSNLVGFNPWLTSSLIANSGVNAWNIEGADVETSSTLTSNLFTPTGISLLSFWHQYNIEPNFDGGMIEFSDNNGLSWQMADSLFLQDKYEGEIVTNNSNTQNAFFGYQYNFKQAILDLKKYVNKPIRLRYKYYSDNSNGFSGISSGWTIDDIVVAKGCGNYIRIFLYDSLNKPIDSTIFPVFITPKILPVRFINILAQKKNSQVLVKWQVGEEKNVGFYLLQKSVNNREWINIGTINANNSLEYNLIDKLPHKALNYYRIKAVDKNGTFAFSETRVISFTENKNFVTILPNPAKDLVKIIFSKDLGSSKIQIVNALGQVLMSKTISNSLTTELNTSKLNDGLYFLNIFDDKGNFESQKLIINK
jgi:extracellular elastinolytic metalloproteinase